MKTLKTIQTVFKVGRVLTIIVFVCSIVGFSLCAVGLFSVAIGLPILKIGGVTIQSLIPYFANMSTPVLFAEIITAMLACAGEAVVAGFEARYFKNELKDGTPFTFSGAKELKRLGIIMICVTFGTQLVSGTFCAVIEALCDCVVETGDSLFSSSAAMGVVFLVISLICKLGAEQAAMKNTENVQ